LRPGPRQSWKRGKESQRRDIAKIGSFYKHSTGAVRTIARSAKHSNANWIAIALFLGLAVGGLAVGRNVAIDQAQQVHAGQPHYVGAQGNAHDFNNNIVQALGGGSSQASGTDEIVPVSDCKDLGCHDTEQGSIEVTGGYMPTVLPLCINNDTVGNWYADLTVIGGYTPYDGFVCFVQKHEFAGKVYLLWHDMGAAPSCGESWHLTYYVKHDFVLDSNQYPTLIGDAVIPPPGQTTIPGKEVCLSVVTFWKGCHEPNQFFTILSAQQDLNFLDILPSPQLRFAGF
jgi:hypothetical protein